MKRFLASLLGVVVFFLLVPTCVILVAREITSEKTIGKILEVAPQLVDEESGGETIAQSIINEMEKRDPEAAKYFKEDELQEQFVILISSALQNLGNPDAENLFDITEFKKYFENVLDEYEEDTGEEIPEDYVDDLFESMELDLISREEIKQESGEVLVIFETIYSNSVLITLISGIALCIILMFILLGNIKDTLSKAKTPFMVNGILIVLLGSGVSALLKSGELNGAPVPLDLISTVTFPFYKIGAISIVISVILIVVSKVLTHNKSISNSNDAIENLGNTTYIPNNNITNTPYNGYQNH